LLSQGISSFKNQFTCKELLLKEQNCRIGITQGNHNKLRRRGHEDTRFTHPPFLLLTNSKCLAHPIAML